jgi:hypothetical protein
MRDFMRQYRAAGKDKAGVKRGNAVRAFVGFDGEGATLDSGYHAYFMLRIGTSTLRPQGSNVRLSTMECLDFISRQDPRPLYVAYFFDYDITKILEDLPWQKLDRLVNRHKRTGINGQVFPVDYNGFQIDYLPRKEFKVRRVISQTEDTTNWSPWITVSDVGTFFQMSFHKAIQVWDIGTAEEQEQIRVGKGQRASFDVKDFDDIAEYNALEIELLQQLMDKFRAACVKAGYVPARWQGPGLLAEAMFRAHGVPQTSKVSLLQDDKYKPLLKMAMNAYYGGRFEVAHIGPVSDPVVQYDINSAYPHAMRFVPCLIHGEWKHVEGSHLDSKGLRRNLDTPSGVRGESFALCYGSFKLAAGAKRTLWFGLPVRTPTGTIVFPECGKGWYWSFEIASAVHQDFTVDSMWIYTRKCECRPLSFVEGVYKERKRIGKDGPGIILKLGLNSLYGKSVQSIGTPKYSNPIWGSFITAFPRMMLQDFIHGSPFCRNGDTKGVQCGRDIVMLATDSVASLMDRSSDVCVSEELGAWSSEDHPQGMFVVQPGVYFGSSGKPTKTRGFTRTVVDTYEQSFRDAFTAMVASGDLQQGQVALPVHVFVGIRFALQRRNMSLLGQWIEYGTDEVPGKVLSFDWTSKRMPMSLNPTMDRPWILTLPYQGSVENESVPYSRDIGGLLAREEDRLAFADLPDWSPLGDIYDE